MRLRPTGRKPAGTVAPMYKAMNLLNANIDKVDKAVFSNTADLFYLEVDLIFYDTNTVSFLVDDEHFRPPV